MISSNSLAECFVPCVSNFAWSILGFLKNRQFFLTTGLSRDYLFAEPWRGTDSGLKGARQIGAKRAYRRIRKRFGANALKRLKLWREMRFSFPCAGPSFPCAGFSFP